MGKIVSYNIYLNKTGEKQSGPSDEWWMMVFHFPRLVGAYLRRHGCNREWSWVRRRGRVQQPVGVLHIGSQIICCLSLWEPVTTRQTNKQKGLLPDIMARGQQPSRTLSCGWFGLQVFRDPHKNQSFHWHHTCVRYITFSGLIIGFGNWGIQIQIGPSSRTNKTIHPNVLTPVMVQLQVFFSFNTSNSLSWREISHTHTH